MFGKQNHESKIDISITSPFSTTPVLLQNYLDVLKRQGVSRVKDYKTLVMFFYRFLLQNYTIDGDQFIKHKLEEKHIAKYQTDLKERVKNKEIALSYAQSRNIHLKKFLNFLYEVHFLTKKIVVPYFNIGVKNDHLKKKYPNVIMDFLKHLEAKSYSHLDVYKYSSQYFCSFVWPELIETNSELPVTELKKQHIKEFEDLLWTKIKNGELATPRAKELLYHLNLFLEFLSEKHLITIQYTIPKKFRKGYSRSNRYVPVEDSVSLLKAISQNSHLKERDLALVLLLIDTGCRPIEAANLRLQDLRWSEATVTFFSIKSVQRNIKISKPVVKALKLYLNVRKLYTPQNENFFVSRFGTPLRAHDMARILNRFNKAAFDEHRHSPRSYRHTFVTNALDNHNPLPKVSNTVGHRWLGSTIHYLHRSKKRLIQNTLPFDPTMKFTSEDS